MQYVLVQCVSHGQSMECSTAEHVSKQQHVSLALGSAWLETLQMIGYLELSFL